MFNKVQFGLQAQDTVAYAVEKIGIPKQNIINNHNVGHGSDVLIIDNNLEDMLETDHLNRMLLETDNIDDMLNILENNGKVLLETEVKRLNWKPHWHQYGASFIYNEVIERFKNPLAKHVLITTFSEALNNEAKELLNKHNVQVIHTETTDTKLIFKRLLHSAFYHVIKSILTLLNKQDNIEDKEHSQVRDTPSVNDDVIELNISTEQLRNLIEHMKKYVERKKSEDNG